MLGEKEGEMEHEIIIRDIFHEHPLSRIPNLAVSSEFRANWCRGCWRYLIDGDTAYGCSRSCCSDIMFHKECIEMPREIRHPLHPSHTLTLQPQSHYRFTSCVVCEVEWGGLFYKCSGGCEVKIHMGCAGSFDIVSVDEDEKMEHPSHPQHLLKKTRSCSCSFQCNACGIIDSEGSNSSYICTVCDYWIHEKCALLTSSELFPSHHHSLTLSFNPPYEYVRYEFYCDICGGPLPLRRWVYHCYLCKYVVHLNCATKAPPIEKE